jgi:hypothetical protein
MCGYCLKLTLSTLVLNIIRLSQGVRAVRFRLTSFGLRAQRTSSRPGLILGTLT